MALTQQEIAKKLGISEMTVYRCMCNHGSVSSQTREKIENFVRESGYQPNLMARSLVRKKSFLIGVLVPSLTSPFYLEILEVMQNIFKQHNYHLLLSSSNGNPETEAEELNVFRSIPVTGILWCPLNGSKSARNCRKILNQQIPLVLFDRCFFPGEAAHDYGHVVTDSAGAARQLTEYLIGLGHRRIALLADNLEASSCRAIEQGYRAALAGHGIEAVEPLLISGNGEVTGIEFGKRALSELIDRNAPFTAVQAVSDEIAIGVMESAREHDLQIPGDFSLAGFGGVSILPYLSVRLTTIQEDKAEMGRKAAEMLLEEIEQYETDTAAESRQIQLPGTLTEGASCRRV